MNTRILVSSLGILVLGTGGAAALGQAGPVIVREGAGERRATLEKMELAPFPAAAWSGLSDWADARAFAAGDAKGSVVLICTFSDWYDPAKRAWGAARRLGDAKGKDGLVVVGAFHPDGWDAFKKDPAKPASKDARVYVGHDAKGEFRKAILSDQDPDFFVIDRAGQLRFADIESESVENAVNALLAETPEQAAAVKGKIADAAAAADADFRKSGAIRQSVDLKSLPEVPFTDPAPADYEKATWPKKEVNENSRSDDTSPRTIALPPTGPFFPRPPQLKGRAIVIYVWNPDFRASYDKVMPQMDRLQSKHGRDVAIVGAAIFTTERNSSSPSIDPKDAVKKVEKFTASRSFEHSLTLFNEGMIGAGRNETEVPYVVVASSNGVVRWAGRPTSPGFEGALAQVIGADPAVKARRAAEEAYIKAQAK